VSDFFITDNFMLQNDTAARLYHDYAKPMPIIDYHTHLPPNEIAEDRRFDNLAQIWLNGDHYKWRAMRANGVPEQYCTGSDSDWEKFEKWAETVPKTLRNPLYHWTHLELKNPFGIKERLLCPETAKEIWDETKQLLAEDSFSARGILKKMNVVLLCTTDDPADSLEHHLTIAKDRSFDIKVLPTFRPDQAMQVHSAKAFNDWVDRLSSKANIDITDFDSLLEALRDRHDFFHSNGCRLSDNGMENFYAEDFTESKMKAIFRQIRSGNELKPDEILLFQSGMLHEFAVMNHEKGWTQQYHFGVIRNNRTSIFEQVGPDMGCDSMCDGNVAKKMNKFFDRLDVKGQLAKTIVYNLNPAHNELVATTIANFQDGKTPGKMQYGSGWWFLDQKDGMERQIEAISNQCLLSHFVGMLTDGRSFLSFTRHEYFRRILCNILGTDMEQGQLPNDIEMIGSMVRNISYNNAANFFGFDL